MRLDTNDPFLKHNLNRLEARFRKRYYSSVQKNANRNKAGKPPHKTILRSMEENRKRLEKLKAIRAVLFQNGNESNV